VHKKYSHRFITLRMNHCSHVDFFTDVFSTFLDLECGNFIAFYGRLKKKKLGFHQKYLTVCVLKMNEGLGGLETAWGWVLNGWTNLLRNKWKIKPPTFERELQRKERYSRKLAVHWKGQRWPCEDSDKMGHSCPVLTGEDDGHDS